MDQKSAISYVVRCSLLCSDSDYALISKVKKNFVCSECSSTQIHVDPKNGEIICETCGLVVAERKLSYKPEWRAFDHVQREKLPRTGSPMTQTRHDMGLSTVISWKNIDSKGKTLSPETRSKIYRLRKWNRRSKITSAKSRNLSQAMSDIDRLGAELNLPRNVLETASVIYRKALKKNVTKGRIIKDMTAASIYSACRQCGVVRALTEVSETANISRNVLSRNYRLLHRKLGLNLPRVQRTGYINRLVSRLKLLGCTELLSMKILEEASNSRLTQGKSPGGIAAACIYISSCIMGDGLTQHQIALEANVTEVTIRNRYKELLNNLIIEILI